jgi:glycosyltransferase involved in cell wall biosynthesis
MFIPFPYYGGLQEFAIELACRLRIPLLLVGDKNAVLRDLEEKLALYKAEVHWVQQDTTLFRNPLIINPRSYYQVSRLLKEYPLVHLNGPFPLIENIVLSYVTQLIFTYHYDIELRNVILNNIGKIYGYTLLNRVLKKANIITASSKYFVADSPYLRRYSCKVRILPLGVDIDILRPTFKYNPWILFIGRIIPEKGVDMLIKAFEVFSRSNPEYELIIIGKPVDLRYWQHLKLYVREKNLEKRVIFTGYLPRNDMINILEKSSVLVLPSLTKLDSFGIVLLEASSLAIPIIASNIVPGARELIESSRNGILVTPRDYYSLAEAIKKIVENPRDYGMRGREYVVKNHNWNIVLQKALQIYKLVSSHER